MSDSSQSSYAHSVKGLENLKNSFLLYFIGYLVAFVPVAGLVSGILDFVGLILIILAFRTLGKSSLLQGMQNYKSTGRWLIWGLIIAIIVIFVGSIVAVGTFIAALASSNFFSGTPPTNPFVLPGFVTFLYEFGAVIALGYGVWLAVWIKMCLSLRKLSREVSQPRIGTTAVLYVVSIFVGIALGLGFVLILLTMNPSTYSAFFTSIQNNRNLTIYGIAGYFFLGGFWGVLGIVAIAADVIQVVANYLGYRGVSSALANLRPPPPPTSPSSVAPTHPPSVAQSGASQQMQQPRTCPRCGFAISDEDARFCPSCGANLGT